MRRHRGFWSVNVDVDDPAVYLAARILARCEKDPGYAAALDAALRRRAVALVRRYLSRGAGRQ